MVSQVDAESIGAGDWWAVAEGDSVADRVAVAIRVATAAEQAVVIQGEAEGVDSRVAVDATGVRAMGFESLAHCFAVGRRIVSRDGACVGWRRGHGRIENAAENPIAAFNGTRAKRRGGDRQHRP